MYYVKFRIWVTSELCYSLEYNVDALNVKWKDHLSKETIMKRKRKAFVKVFIKLSWFLLISGLGLILACRSWSQIRVLGLGHDILSQVSFKRRIVESDLLMGFGFFVKFWFIVDVWIHFYIQELFHQLWENPFILLGQNWAREI